MDVSGEYRADGVGVGVYTTPTQLAQAQKARFTRVMHKQEEVHDELARAGLEDFLEAVSGPLKTKQLRQMGHPYAKTQTGPRGAKPGTTGGLKGQITKGGFVKPIPVNVQSGALRRLTRLSGPSGPFREYLLGSYAKHAKYVLRKGGTRRMVERPVFDHVRKRHKARLAMLMAEVRRVQSA